MKVEIYKCRPKMKFPIVAWLIMIFQGMAPWKKESFSHMAIRYDDTFIDINGGGFNHYGVEEFENKYKFIDKKEIEFGVDVRFFMAWIEEQINKKYDKAQVFGLMLKAFGFITFNSFGSNYKKLICSELVLSFLETFLKVHVGDPDNWDLNMTWELVCDTGHSEK